MIKKPTPARFKLKSNNGIVWVDGWTTSWTLGFVEHGYHYASILLLPGVVLATGFETKVAVARFNEMVRTERRYLFPGALSLEEFYKRAGGVEKAAEIIEKLKREAQKENANAV